jgi:formylglycine-generating enzyme required for sulfatase activity
VKEANLDFGLMRQDDFGSTAPNIRVPAEDRQVRPAAEMPPPPPPPSSPPPPGHPAKRRIPIWIFLIGGGVLLLILAALIYFLWPGSPGFTLIVKGAEPGSAVFVDNRRYGVTAGDGSIQVPGLKAGKRLVRVSHDGYADFNTSVTGKDGEEKIVIAQLTQTGPQPQDPQVLTEIDYNGPMILIPAGEFIMGSDNHEADEKPAHKVTLPDYYIDKFEVTNEWYKRFCDETKRKYPTDPWWEKGYFTNKPQAPVIGIEWADAAAFAKWAGKRLATEEEWEKAASWGPKDAKKRQYPWGESFESGRATLGGEPPPSSVGSNPTGASAYGVQDMAGNVFEWIDAFYQPYQGNAESNENYGSKNRVVRGGHFGSKPDLARTTDRTYTPPVFTSAEKRERSWLIGFRCVVSADDPKLQERIRVLQGQQK